MATPRAELVTALREEGESGLDRHGDDEDDVVCR